MSRKNKMTVEPPKAEEVAGLTDRLIEIEAEVKRLNEEKKDIEARLEAYALSLPEKHERLKDETREGRRVMLGGGRRRLPVVFSSDLLIASFQDGSPKHKELLAIIAKDPDLDAAAVETLLLKFFSKPSKWDRVTEDGQEFRRLAAYWLKAETAALFLEACRQVDKFGIPKSKTTFDYKAAEDTPAATGADPATPAAV
jgi:hypothetical protein